MDPKELVQPLLVVDREDNTHEQVIYDVAWASGLTYLGYTAYGQTRSWSPAWKEWLNGRFTKSVRKLKPKDMIKVDKDLFCGFQHNTAEIRTFAPLYPIRYEDFDPVVRKAQVQGLEYNQVHDFLHPEAKVQIVVNPKLGMSTGKTAAQVAHAWMGYLIRMDSEVRKEMYHDLGTPIEFGLSWPKNFDKLPSLITIADAGLTEIPSGTVTAKVLV